MEVRVLGPLEIDRDGELRDLGGRKQRSVLAVLVLRAREAVGADRIADAVWDGEPPASAEGTLRSYVSNLRKALEPDRDPKDPPRILRTTPAGYCLDVPDDAIDARRFERLVARGREWRATDAAGAVAAWKEALALWRGDAYQDFAYDTFAQIEAARLTELKLACREDLFEAQLELGRHDAVVGDLEAFCASHPERERALASRMLALYRCGRQTEALGAYEEGRRRLADELGVEPSAEIRALHEGILRQDEELAAVVPAAEPSGKHTLTFLLGDVELSTERLRALGDDYADALDEHRRVLREALRAHGGRAIRTYGDEAFAAFDCATDAMAAAVAVQLELGRAVPDEGRRFPVRIGLHTGEAAFSGGEYVGLAVHLAARVMAAAHGGQILVSGATKELFEAEEGRAVDLLDTGTHTLEDISDAVRLFQVVHPELRRDFPPLRTRPGRTDNLPNRLKSFVGREPDLEGIEEALAEAPLVTLTGVGGIGKTRLAVEAGRRLLPRYPDGVWLCELAPIGDADAFVHSIANTLGLEPQVGRCVRDGLLAALRQRESLVILDNCEHLLAPVAELVDDIVHGGGGTDVLATSRETLDVEGERAHPVRSLEAVADDRTPDAVRLFEDRANARRPDFTVEAANASAVADICAKLDGIPLAIELAAARVVSLTPAQIAERLEDDLQFLRSDRRLAVDRHRTLRAAIDWSYHLLSEPEKLLFDRLSVFAGGFTIEAVEEVCGHGLALDVADGLASLVAKSMINADVTGAEARYFLLETMRQYALDGLAERGEADDIFRSHAAYFVRMVADGAAFIHGGSERAVQRLVLEFDDLRAAQAWARASGDVALAVPVAVGAGFLSTMLLLPEGYRWAEEALAMPGAEDHELLPVLLTVAASGVRRRGEPERAKELLLRALEIVEDPDDARRLLALNWRVLVSLYEGKPDEAREWRSEYLRVARANDDLGHQVAGYCVGAIVESVAGEHKAAIDEAETGYTLARRGSSLIQGYALVSLGQVLSASGPNVERALDCLDRGIELCRANEMHYWVGLGLVSVASLRALHGDPFDALEMFGNLVERWRRAGDRARQWVTLRNLAELFGRLGLDEPAAALVAGSETSASGGPGTEAQSERLAALRHQLAERMGDEAFAAATERGRTMPDEEAVAYAKAEIDRSLEDR